MYGKGKNGGENTRRKKRMWWWTTNANTNDANLLENVRYFFFHSLILSSLILLLSVSHTLPIPSLQFFLFALTTTSRSIACFWHSFDFRIGKFQKQTKICYSAPVVPVATMAKTVLNCISSLFFFLLFCVFGIVVHHWIYAIC